MPDDEKILIESITSPHHRDRVDKAKYMAMRDALLAALPGQAPGLTVAEANLAILPHLSEVEFPWWRKGRMVVEGRSAGFGSQEHYPARSGKTGQTFQVSLIRQPTLWAIRSDHMTLLAHKRRDAAAKTMSTISPARWPHDG